MKMFRLAALYGFALPFTSVLALSGWLNLPTIVGACALAILLVRGVGAPSEFDLSIFFLFVVPAVFSAILNINHLADGKFVNHFSTYFFVYAVFYVAPRELLRRYPKPLLFGALVGLLFSIGFEYAEFLTGVFFGAEYFNKIPRYTLSEYDATYAGFVLRARSVVEESGHYALYLGILAPIAFLSVWRHWSRLWLTLFVSTVVLALILTFSTSGIVFSIISLLIVSFLFSERIDRGAMLGLGVVCVASLLYFFIRSVFDLDLTTIVTNKSEDFNGRQPQFEHALAYFQNTDLLHVLFGLGPGYYSYRGLESVISLPALTAFQNGLIGLICYILMFLLAFLRVKSIFPVAYRFPLYFALLYSWLVYGGVSNYWYPWLWFLFAVISVGPSVFAREVIFQAKV